MQQNKLNLLELLPLPQQRPVIFLLPMLNISSIYIEYIQSKPTALAACRRRGGFFTVA